MPYKDPDKAREASRKSYHKHKERTKLYRNPKSRLRRVAERDERAEMLASFPCICCGHNDHIITIRIN